MNEVKSFATTNPRLLYAISHSTPLNENIEELIQLSITQPRGLMTGARGVLQMCSAVLEMIQAKNILDIGLFTGVSALTWATVIPADGKIISMDITDDPYVNVGKAIIEKSGLAHKIDIRIQPALKTLQDLIDAGQSNKFDFCFIDANKSEYPMYYDLCLQLLRTGGVIAVDNAIWLERVLMEEKDELTAAIDKLNKMASTDPQVRSVLLPWEDGLHLIVKK